MIYRFEESKSSRNPRIKFFWSPDPKVYDVMSEVYGPDYRSIELDPDLFEKIENIAAEVEWNKDTDFPILIQGNRHVTEKNISFLKAKGSRFAVMLEIGSVRCYNFGKKNRLYTLKQVLHLIKRKRPV